MSLFDQNNCRGCPIQGQREVTGVNSKDKQGLWKIVGVRIYLLINRD